MGFFNIINDLLDDNSNGSFEKKLSGVIDRVEDTLNTTLEKAEVGIKQASTAIDKLDGTATLVEEKVSVAAETAEKTIETIEKKI
jgi:flagellar hook-basal body complex protein FliE